MTTSTDELKESRLRSVLKTFSWRVIATFTTAVIAFAINGEIDTAILIGAIEFIAKMFLYYMHERAWQLVPRGTIRNLKNAL